MPELNADREFVLEAVKQNRFALYYVAPELKTGRELVLEAVKQKREALGFAAPELKADRRFSPVSVIDFLCMLCDSMC